MIDLKSIHDMWAKDCIIDEMKLDESSRQAPIIHSKYLELLSINKELWVIEDDIREKERQKEFDEDFIKLARAVYYTNDVRAKIKKEINLKYGSGFVEEKSYSQY